jgi:hypothetical protein
MIPTNTAPLNKKPHQQELTVILWVEADERKETAVRLDE